MIVALGAMLLVAGRAEAQLHWDVGAKGGVSKRFLSSRPPGAPDAGLGPEAEVEGHVAVLPMLRAGLYAAYDRSPVTGIAARNIMAAGLHVRVNAPWPRDPFRGWVYLGFGYAGVYAPSYETTLLVQHDPAMPASPTRTTVQGSGGTFFEVPVGLGVAYKLRRPWELTLELGTRVGFGWSGSTYTSGAVALPDGAPAQQIQQTGNDSFAVLLSLGVSCEL